MQPKWIGTNILILIYKYIMETTTLAMFRKTVQYDGQLIWVRTVCDFFNLDVQNQYTRIKNDAILGKLYGKNSTDLLKSEILYEENAQNSSKNRTMVRKNRPDLGKIDENGRILLSKKGFIRWIQIINANKIAVPMRERFVKFQELIFDYLYGIAEDEENIKLHYARLQKLERLYSKIGNEIKREKTTVAQLLNGRYTQLSLNFSSGHQLAAN